MGKNKVKVDKHALYNAMLANQITSSELSIALGKSTSYISYMTSDKGGKGEFNEEMYEQMKGMLGITDDSLIKAIPIIRRDSDTSIISPYIATEKKTVAPAFGHFNLDEDNEEFVELVSKITSAEKETIINNIIREYFNSSELGMMVERIKDITSAWCA